MSTEWNRWQARYDQCVAEGIPYRGILGSYDPPGEP